ncbi:MAG: hypothetical protein HRT41_15665 [Campylobacteraceae bacterium]|nr:hypothetical protein [Campylobacteraceae bacterium]
MIVTVKRSKNKKMRILSFIALGIMFFAYYNYMSEEYGQDPKQMIVEKKVDSLKLQKSKLAKRLEKVIYKEIEASIDLIGQEYIKQVKVVKNKVVIITEADTNIDAITVRYGSIALVKKSKEDTKIAIDIKYIIDAKYKSDLHIRKSTEMKNDKK